MPDHFFVYPAYLDRAVSRALGRRVAAALALADITAEEIVAAARGLGFTVEAEPERQYPRVAHAYAGRVRVAKKAGVTKARFLGELAAEVARRRGTGGTT